jgi:hypothetical protein
MGDVVAEQLEGLVTEQVLDIAPRAGKEVVDAKDLAAGVEQSLAQMGPKESRAPETRTRRSTCMSYSINGGWTLRGSN